MTTKRNEVRYGQEQFERIGEALEQIGRACEGYRELSVQPTGMSIRAPRSREGEYLVVIRGEDNEGMPVVAFNSGHSIGEAVRGVEARLSNGTLRWREDEFAS